MPARKVDRRAFVLYIGDVSGGPSMPSMIKVVEEKMLT
jgi:hypothetical protein